MKMSRRNRAKIAQGKADKPALSKYAAKNRPQPQPEPTPAGRGMMQGKEA